MTTFKVGSKTDCKKLAGAIAAIIQKDDDLELTAIGSGAVNQAIKSIAISRIYIKPFGIDITVIPSFKSIDISGVERSVINIEVRRISL